MLSTVSLQPLLVDSNLKKRPNKTYINSYNCLTMHPEKSKTKVIFHTPVIYHVFLTTMPQHKINLLNFLKLSKFWKGCSFSVTGSSFPKLIVEVVINNNVRQKITPFTKHQQLHDDMLLSNAPLDAAPHSPDDCRFASLLPSSGDINLI